MALEKSIPIGSEGALDFKIDGGKVILTGTHVHASGSVSVVVSEDAKYFLEKLKVMIPGTIDDYLITLAEATLP